MLRSLAVALLCLVTAWSVRTVAQDTKPPAAFEVASIKPIQAYPPYPNFFIEINKLRGNHVTARVAVAAAYGVDRRQVVGGSAWMDSDRFNIDARAANRLPPKGVIGLPEPVATMMRGLLADRFQLRARRETREMSVLALTHVRVDRIVIDDTGIAGNVDLHFEWPFFRNRQEEHAAAMVALEEQVGLKLVSRKAPVPVVVVERIQRPSPN